MLTLPIGAVVLKIVTHLVWGHVPNVIICVGASCSYPYRFITHYSLLVKCRYVTTYRHCVPPADGRGRANFVQSGSFLLWGRHLAIDQWGRLLPFI